MYHNSSILWNHTLQKQVQKALNYVILWIIWAITIIMDTTIWVILDTCEIYTEKNVYYV